MTLESHSNTPQTSAPVTVPVFSRGNEPNAPSPHPTEEGGRETTAQPAAETQRSIARVLHVVNGEHFAGAARVQSHLGQRLPELGIRADFACLKNGKFLRLNADAAHPWGECYLTEMKSRFDLRPVRAIRNLIREHGYHLLHAHTPRSAMVTSLVARLTGIPWIYHVHSPAARDTTRSVANGVNAFVERYSLMNCDQLITVSKSLREEYMRLGFSRERITVVHNGVPMIQADRDSHPVPGGRWTLGMIALMRPRKGLETALQSIALLGDDYDIRLRLIGPFETESYESDIRSLVDQLGINRQIDYVGFTNDVAAEFKTLDATLLPSLFGEGLPMVVLESMAAGVPVIATRVEGTPEAITHGVEGLLAEPGDPQSLAERIEELVCGVHDWPEMSRAAARRHAADFSDLSMARGTADVYRDVLQASVPDRIHASSSSAEGKQRIPTAP